MGEGKRKRKRSKHKKKKSKSLFVEAVGFESKSIKGNIGKTCLVTLVPSPNEKHKLISNKKGDEISTSKGLKHLKLTKNRIKKRTKIKSEQSNNLAVKSSLGLFDNGSVCVDEHMSPSGTKLKKDSMVFTRQTLSNEVRNCRNDKPSLKEKLKNKLESGRFRWINEKLYTANSFSSFEMFKSEPELFDVYHQGFSSQVQKWPVNPVDTMIDWIKQRYGIMRYLT